MYNIKKQTKKTVQTNHCKPKVNMTFMPDICMYTYNHNCMLEATTLSLPHLILSTAK